MSSDTCGPGTLEEDCEDLLAPNPPRSGAASLLLGASALLMLGSPWLPEASWWWLRAVPVYLSAPVGASAVVSGVGALRDMRGDGDADRRWARAGVALGVVAVAVPVAFVGWMCWALRDL